MTKTRVLLLCGIFALVLMLCLTLCFVLANPINKAYASESHSIVSFDGYWFDFNVDPDGFIYFHGDSGYTAEQSNAYAKMDIENDTVYFYRPENNPIKEISGSTEALEFNFKDAGIYNFDSIVIDDVYNANPSLTLTSDVEGVVLNIHKIDLKYGTNLYINGKITVNVIGTDSFDYENGIVVCNSYAIEEEASLNIYSDSKVRDESYDDFAYLYCTCDDYIGGVVNTKGDISIDITKEVASDDIYCVYMSDMDCSFNENFYTNFGTMQLRALSEDNFFHTNDGDDLITAIKNNILSAKDYKYKSSLKNKGSYLELYSEKATSFTVYFHDNSSSSGGEMPPVEGISGDYVLPSPAFIPKPGAEFEYWAVGNNKYMPGDTINVTKDTTIFFMTTSYQYNVTFDANGGTGSMQGSKVNYNYVITLPECLFTSPNESKTFKCWSIKGVEKAVGTKITIQENTTISAVWETLASYTVSFNSNGGTGTMENITSYPNLTLPTCSFDNAGYNFSGWAVDNVDAEPKPVDSVVVIDGNVTLYAIWDANEAWDVAYAVEINGYIQDYSYLAPEGSNITVKSFAELGFETPLGYTFSHWKEKYTHVDNIAPNSAYVVPDDTTRFVAQFTRNPGEIICTVSFDMGSGSGENIDPVKLLAGDYLVFPICTYTPPTGYEFKAWSIILYEDDNPNVYEYQPMQEVQINADNFIVDAENTGVVNVTASWRQAMEIDFEYTSYVLKDETLDTAYLKVWLVYDDTSKEPIDITLCEFYEGNEIIPAKLIPDIKNYVLTNKGNNIISVKYSTYDAESTFIKVTEEFEVTFNANNQTPEVKDSFKRLDNAKYTLPDNPFTAPSNKEFKAWLVGSEEKQPGEQITITSDVEIKAIWQDKTYYVSFNANGGKGNMEVVEKVLGSYTLPANAFTAPQGKQFKGWSLTSNGDVIETQTIDVTNNTTLYAIWENIPAVTYTITFNSNGGTGTMNPVQYAGNYTLPANGFTPPANKQFKGWALAADGNVIATATINVTAATSLYAIWEDISVDPSSLIDENITEQQASAGYNTTAFADAKAAGKTVKITIGTASILFDSAAVNAIGSTANTTIAMTISDNVAELNIPGAQKVVEITLNGFTAGNATVVVPFTTAVPQGKIAKVYFVYGNSKMDMNATFDGTKATFTVPHFSKYVIVFDDIPAPQPENPDEPAVQPKKGLSGGAIAGIVIAIVVVLAGAGVAVFFVLKSKKSNSSKPQSEEKQDDVVDNKEESEPETTEETEDKKEE